MLDLTSLSDEELSDHLNTVQTEQERRQRLANVPSQIASLSTAFLAGGGDRETLVSAIPEAPPTV